MIARHRGDHRSHSRWRPPPPQASAPQTPAETPPSTLSSHQTPARAPWKTITILLSVALLILAIAIGLRHTTNATRPPAVVLPHTPTAWVQQFTADAVDDPTDVCHHLFAPALAAVFKADTGKTCMAYYNQVDSRSYRIRHTLQDGPTAAIEAHQLGYGHTFGYFTILLTHLQTGWQAIDIVPGGSVRAR
jgi:hypothetical protein